MTADELLPLIAPSLGDKYSPNLHAWSKKNWAGRDAHMAVTNPDKLGICLVGRKDDEGWFYGSNLIAVLCNGAKEPTWAYRPGDARSRTGIDPDFWPRYIATGRCAIDTQHGRGFIGDENRYQFHQDGQVRVCQWCGHVQVKLSWDETVSHSEWVAV